MSDSTRESAYFYRIITLVVGVGTETLREVFYSKVPKADVAKYFSPLQIAELNRLKGRHILSNVQYQHVTVSPDPDKYDITLLLILLTNKKISGINPPTTGWGASPDPADFSLGADLLRLRAIRNDLVGHRPNTRLELSEYKKCWGDVEIILVRIAGSVSPAEEVKVKQKIEDAEKRLLEPLDDREEKLLKVFLQWRKEEDERNKAQLKEVQDSLESLHIKFDGIPKSPSTDEVDAVRSEDTLSSLQSQVNSIAQSMGTMAQQGAVQQIHQNVQNMQGDMSTLHQTVQMLQKLLEEKQEENKRFVEEIKQLRRQASGDRGPSVIYPRQPQKKPKITNPNAMSEKEIFDLSRQIGYEWEQLRIHLDFTEAQGHALKRAHDDDAQQRIHVMLKSWHDVVAECGENPRMLLAAAFVNAAKNYSMAYKLVPQKSFDANATARESTVERIQEISFRKGGQGGDQGDGYYGYGRNSPYNYGGRDSPYGYGGQGALNVYGGDVRIEGSLAIHSSSSSLSNNTSMMSSDGQGGAGTLGLPHSGSFNVFDGRVTVGAGSNVVIGPPGSNYPSQGYTQAVRGEGLDVPDSSGAKLRSSACSGQPFKKQHDDTLSQTMVAALNEQMKSVGVLVSHGDVIGTVFRVGTNYVMTACHVIRAVIDPAGRDEFDLTRLESNDTYINFNESAIVPPVVQYRMKKDFIFNTDLDVAVLEISNPSSNFPMKMNLRKPKFSETRVTNVSLIGYGHTNHPKKVLDPKCEILSPSSQRIRSALAWLQQNLINCKYAMQQSNQSPELVDSGYHGYDHPSKITFDCFMEHGGSGAPALTNNNERSVEVVGVLTHGLPEFYFKLSPQLQAEFPKEYRLELGAKMTSIYEWIKATRPEEFVNDLFN